MAGFNLNDYETVKQRKLRFYADHPNGRIIVDMQNDDVLEMALFKATVYLNPEDQKSNAPRSTGFAFEIRDKQLSKNSYGKEYESVNYSSWVENCEESAVGRALDNAGYASNAKCSKEEIEKANRMKETLKPQVNLTPTTITQPPSKLPTPTDLNSCEKCGGKLTKGKGGKKDYCYPCYKAWRDAEDAKRTDDIPF